MRLLHKLVKLNIQLSNAVDSILPAALRIDGNNCFVQEYLPLILKSGETVWDVGSGARPFIRPDDRLRLGLRVVGLDISAAELAAAPAGSYDRAVVADLCSFSGDGEADSVICQALLEHVPDTAGAMRALTSIIKPGGQIYIFVPCRNALFAQMNLVLPERLKRRLLFALYPAKARGHDGFKAWYDRCTPRGIEALARENGLEVDERRLFWISSYFKAFTPAFVLWRLLQGIAWLIIRSEAAETFVYVLRKPLRAGPAS